MSCILRSARNNIIYKKCINESVSRGRIDMTIMTIKEEY